MRLDVPPIRSMTAGMKQAMAVPVAERLQTRAAPLAAAWRCNVNGSNNRCACHSPLEHTICSAIIPRLQGIVKYTVFMQ